MNLIISYRYFIRRISNTITDYLIQIMTHMSFNTFKILSISANNG